MVLCDPYSEMAGECGGNVVLRFARRYEALKSGADLQQFGGQPELPETQSPDPVGHGSPWQNYGTRSGLSTGPGGGLSYGPGGGL